MTEVDKELTTVYGNNLMDLGRDIGGTLDVFAPKLHKAFIKAANKSEFIKGSPEVQEILAEGLQPYNKLKAYREGLISDEIWNKLNIKQEINHIPGEVNPTVNPITGRKPGTKPVDITEYDKLQEEASKKAEAELKRSIGTPNAIKQAEENASGIAKKEVANPEIIPTTVGRVTGSLEEQLKVEEKGLKVMKELGQSTPEAIAAKEAKVMSLKKKAGIAGIIGGITLIPLAALMPGSSDTAEAGIAPEAAEATGRYITDFAFDVAKKAVKLTDEEVMQNKQKILDYVNTNHLVESVQTNPKELPEFRQYSARGIPSDSVISRRNTLPFGLGRVLSFPVLSKVFYGNVAETGGKYSLASDPAIEVGSRINTIEVNTLRGIRTSLNIVKDVEDFKYAGKEIEEAMSPLVKKYWVNGVVEYNFVRDQAAKFNKLAIRSAKKFSKTGSVEDMNKFEVYNKQFEGFNKRIEELKPVRETLDKDYTPIATQLSAQHSDARLFYGSEDTAAFEYTPWLNGIVKPDEMIAIGYSKKMMEKYAGYMAEMGENPILSRPYMHHATHPDMDFAAAEKVIQSYIPESEPGDALRLVHFHSRSDAPAFMPSWEYAMRKYFPDANRRLEWKEFWDKKNPNGWYQHYQRLLNSPNRNEGLVQFWKGFESAFDPIDKTGIDTWARRIHGFDVARLIAWSASVPFKHVIKEEAGIGIFGPVETTKAMTKSADMMFYNARSKDLGKLGILSDRGIKDNELYRVATAYANQGRLDRTLSDVYMPNVPDSWWDRFLDKAIQYGTIPTTIVEKFDRGVSALASIEMAAKLGMTPTQAIGSVMDTIFRTNFLAGPVNPKWLRDPKVRMLFVFQGTPFKILEQRAQQVVDAGKDIKGAAKELLTQLGILKSEVKGAEHTFKWEAIQHALTYHRDVFGTPITQQVMRRILTLGCIVGVGKSLFDLNLEDHVFHTPFIKHWGAEPALGVAPLVSASLKTWQAKDNEETWFTDFLQSWWGGKYGPIPTTIQRLIRINQNDIPEVYRQGAMKYLFAIPTWESGKE
jgi:hypothetical protein